MVNKNINVLYVEENQDGTTGGSHYCLLDLVRQIDKGNFNPFVMFYEINNIVGEFKEAGAKVIIYFKPLGSDFARKLEGTRLECLTRLFICRLVQKVYNVVKTSVVPLVYFAFFILVNRIHVVHTNNSVFAGFEWVIAAKLTGRKIVGHERGYHYNVPDYCGFHSRMYDYILGVSIATRNSLSNLGFDLRNYATFYDRIDAEEFKGRVSRNQEEIRREFQIEDKQAVIGIVGNLQRWKGQLTVLEAIHLLTVKYPEVVCLIIGDVSNRQADDLLYYKEVKATIARYSLEDSVILTGNRRDIPDILEALDVFVHASIRPEPYGLVVLEAMVMGKAIVASNEGGPVEMIVDGESGFLVKPDNPEALAARLDALLSDPSLRKWLGDNAQIRVKDKFSTLDIGFIENLYRGLLKVKC